VELKGIVYDSQLRLESRTRSLPVDKETFNPVLKKSLNGFLSYVRNKALFDRGDMASPTCLR
jgi:hypothetical protein